MNRTAAASLVLLICLFFCHNAESLTPLTQIAPSEVELAAFVSTLHAAIDATLSGPRAADSQGRPIAVHIVGVNFVEQSIDWAPLCASGRFNLLLIGPMVDPVAKLQGSPVVQPLGARRSHECVCIVRSLYSREAVADALGDTHPLALPDIIFVFNADIYMPVWRRSLVAMVAANVPILVTFYCEYEGKLLSDLLDAPQVQLSADAVAACDADIAKKYRQDAALFLQPAIGPAPARIEWLWRFSPNPHAHLPPRSCVTVPYQHGVRNSFWVAFRGATFSDADAAEVADGGKDEL